MLHSYEYFVKKLRGVFTKVSLILQPRSCYIDWAGSNNNLLSLPGTGIKSESHLSGKLRIF